VADRRAAMTMALERPLGALLIVLLSACTAPPPPPATLPPPAPPPPPLKRLTVGEMQQMVDGAARLNRACRDQRSDSGLYLVRLFIEPEGKVSKVEPRRAPSRDRDAAAYAGVARYIDGDRAPDTPVVECFATAFRKLRFRPFGGDTVAFDYPIVVENLPPAETISPERRCISDEDCVFRPLPRCACPPCGPNWHRALNRQSAERQKRQARSSKCPRHRRCAPCGEPMILLGAKALCLDGQCSVR
jgi:hypothetical protein